MVRFQLMSESQQKAFEGRDFFDDYLNFKVRHCQPGYLKNCLLSWAGTNQMFAVNTKPPSPQIVEGCKLVSISGPADDPVYEFDMYGNPFRFTFDQIASLDVL